MIDYEAISLEFAARGWEWRDEDGQYFVPTKKDVQLAIEKMVDALDATEEDEVQITVGGLIMQKQGKHYDLYVRAGSYGEED